MNVRASEQAIRKAREALARKGWNETKLLEIAKLQNRTFGSQQRTNFFNGKPVARATADKIGFLLDLTWEHGDLEPELGKNKQDKGSDIDELVQEVRSLCCDKVQNLYSKIQLLNRQQIDIDKLYVDVYVLEKLSSESYATIPDLLKGSDLRNDFDRLGLGSCQKRSPGFEVAAHYSKLMVLGKQGSGKSTFLRHLAVACCKDEFQANHIPILIELRDIKDASHFNLLNKIHKEFGLANQAQTEQILNQGKVLILLDGLDEVPDQSMRDVQDHIYEFDQQYYKNRFILTCRTQTTEYTLSTFNYVEVAEFKPDQVEIFAQNWFTALAETPEEGAELTGKFLGKLRLPENKQTAELAVTPILLSLTCLVFNDLRDLPHKRSDLYEEGINLLLEKWDEKRGISREIGSEAYRKWSVGEKKKCLSYLAARKFEQEKYVLFEQGELQGYIAEYLAEYLGISAEDSEAVLDAARAVQYELLIERAKGLWSFSHLTFQEYFAAKWFCDRPGWQALVSHISDKHWREVFLLTVEMLSSADCLLVLMKQQVDALVAGDQQLQQYLEWINQKCFEVKDDRYKPLAIRTFYFDLTFPRALDQDYFRSFPRQLALALAPDYDRKPLLHSFRRSVAIDKVVPQRCAIDHAHYRDLTQALALALGIDHECIFRFTRGLRLTYPDSYCPIPELKQELQKLKQQLPDPDYEQEICKQWWKDKGKIWAEQFRTLIKQKHYLNIGKDWQFTQGQMKVLQRYYDINWLLVDCLNSAVVSNKVREEIEETLLLSTN